MRNRLPTLAAGLTLALSLLVSPSMAAEVLRVGGTGGATALLERLGRPFTQHTGIAVEVIPSLGSSGGINAAGDGALDLAVSGRSLSVAELARGLVVVVAVRTPYVLATSLAHPPAMAEREIIQVYAAEKAAWPDGSRVKLVLRPRAESDNLVLIGLFPGIEAALNEARRHGDVPVAATDQDNADMAEKLPGSLIGTTYTQILLERRNLRLVTIDGASPTMAAFESGAYRYTKVFHLVHPRQASPAARRFVEFLGSGEGLRTLREAGCLPGAE